jgi:uncharacterized RDD family membrane protein YckC
MDWYYIDPKAAEEKRRRGPWSSQQMCSFAAREYVNDGTLVWHTGLSAWSPWKSVKIDAAEVPAPEAKPLPEVKAPVPHASAENGAAAVPLAYASVWARGAALCLDFCVLQILAFFLSPFLPVPASLPDPWTNPQAYIQASMPLMSAFAGIWFAYNTACVRLFGGTPGKLLMRLSIVREGGKAMTWTVAAWRCIAVTFSQITFGLGYLMAFADPERRALHDFLAGTRVVRKAI